jgi:hypothetical protein
VRLLLSQYSLSLPACITRFTGAEGLGVESHDLLKEEEQKVAKKLGWRADTKRPKPLTGVHPTSVFCLLLIQCSYMRQCQECHKGVWTTFGTFGTPSVSVS